MPTPAAPVGRVPTAIWPRNIIGENVYNGTGDDAENIGDVNDIVIGADGSIESVVDRRRRLPRHRREERRRRISRARLGRTDGDRWLVAPMTKEQLEAQTGVRRSAYEPAPADARRQTPRPQDGMAPATDDTTAAAPADRSGGPGRPTRRPRLRQPIRPLPATDQHGTGSGHRRRRATAAIDRSTLTEMPAGRHSRRGPGRHHRLRRQRRQCRRDRRRRADAGRQGRRL